MSRRVKNPSTSAVRRAPLTQVPLSSTPLPPLDPAATPWPGAMARVSGLDLHVRHTPGAGDSTVVYVHGLGGSSTNWTDLAAQLAPSARGFALDLPGFGRSEPETGFTFSLLAHAGVVADYIEQHTNGPVHLVGNSMGGAIALLLGANRPDLVRTLTLVSPAMPDRRLDPRRLSDPRVVFAYLPLVGRKVRRQIAATDPRQRAEQVVRLCFADPSSVPEQRLVEATEEQRARADLAWAGTAMARSTMEIFRCWFTGGAGSLWAVARTVRAPSLVVWGTEDKVISVRRAARTARALPSSRLLVLPKTGHVAQMERPATVARAMLGMWESVEANAW
ncbi:hydrolase [Prauserella marina]|nr:hydrolase [Prauserella marina]